MAALCVGRWIVYIVVVILIPCLPGGEDCGHKLRDYHDEQRDGQEIVHHYFTAEVTGQDKHKRCCNAQHQADNHQQLAQDTIFAVPPADCADNLQRDEGQCKNTEQEV